MTIFKLSYLANRFIKKYGIDSLVENKSDKEEVYTEFDIYGMKVVVDDSTVTSEQIKQYIDYLKEVYHALKRKKLDRIWYGIIFIKCENCGGEGRLGNYPIKKDVINIFSRPEPEIPYFIIHELGHRYWSRFMHQSQRGKFESLIKVKKGKYLTRNKVDDLHKQISEKIKLIQNAIEKFEKDYTSLPKIEDRASQKKLENVLLNFQNTIGEFEDFCEVEMPSIILNKFNPSQETEEPEYDKQYNYLNSLIEDYLNSSKDIWNFSLAGDLKDFSRKNNETEVIENIKIFKNMIDKSKKDMSFLLRKLYIFVQENPHVNPVSSYGGEHIMEGFAEAFAHYVLEKDMNQDQLESFKSVLKTASTNLLINKINKIKKY